MQTPWKHYLDSAGSRPGLAAALTAVALWSTNAVAARLALAHHGLGPVLTTMLGTACVVLVAVTLRRRLLGKGRPDAAERSWRGRTLAAGLLLGALGLGGTLVLQYAAFAAGPLAETNVVAYGWPMLAALWLGLRSRTRAGWWRLACAVVGLAGVAVMFSQSFSGGGSAGYLAALGSALCMTAYTVAVPRVRMPAAALLVSGALAGVVAGLAILWSTGARLDVDVSLLAAVYCGVGPLAGGYLLWSLAMAQSDSELAPFGYATPLGSTALLLLSGETFAVTTGIGAAVVLLGLIGVLVVDRVSSRARMSA